MGLTWTAFALIEENSGAVWRVSSGAVDCATVLMTSARNGISAFCVKTSLV